MTIVILVTGGSDPLASFSFAKFLDTRLEFFTLDIPLSTGKWVSSLVKYVLQDIPTIYLMDLGSSLPL